MTEKLSEIYPLTISLLRDNKPERLVEESERGTGPETFSERLKQLLPPDFSHPYLVDLAHIEWAVHTARNAPEIVRDQIKILDVNPTLSLIQVSWRGLPGFFKQTKGDVNSIQQGSDMVLVWRDPVTGRIRVRSAGQKDLLALKIVLEELDTQETAEKENITRSLLEGSVKKAVYMGLIIKPFSLITRDHRQRIGDKDIVKKQTAQVFTLQWHITQACDLHCRHCYDRSSRHPVSIESGLRILDDFYRFCQEHHVWGQVSFTGGNPLMHPQFYDLYFEAVQRGFMTAILGNPASNDELTKICSLKKPEFFQVSLEGLEEYNDFIRGSGHFNRVLSFLDKLRAADIYSMVMLTLNRDNIDQVLPLAEILRDKVDLFTFNRLSMVGEGAMLITPSREEFRVFIEDYLKAAESNPILSLKDNLINILLDQQGKELFGGCAGYGCGAAFNFVSLLPDGEVHACRKFPSHIGNINTQSLSEIYHSSSAEAYRTGSSACRNCRIRDVCGGCQAVVYSHGLDVSIDLDPCCFIDSPVC